MLRSVSIHTDRSRLDRIAAKDRIIDLLAAEIGRRKLTIADLRTIHPKLDPKVLTRVRCKERGACSIELAEKLLAGIHALPDGLVEMRKAA